jgi:hypothetical protein
MGQSTNGILLYGYDLAGGDAEWKVREVGEYGEPQVDWFDVEENDFATAAEKRLMASVGFTETDYMADGYFDREREAKARLGVEFKSYCSDGYPMHTLAAKGSVLTAYRGDCKPADFTVKPEWNQLLFRALGVLGLTPTQEQAQWLLCSWWG